VICLERARFYKPPLCNMCNFHRNLELIKIEGEN
jgi:hypothetical protein